MPPSLSDAYCTPSRNCITSGDMQQALLTEVVSVITREQNPDALRGSMLTIFCLAVRFGVPWEPLVREAISSYPHPVQATMARRIEASLGR